MDVVKLLPFQGAWLLAVYPGRCPGLGASALSGRVGQLAKCSLVSELLLFALSPPFYLLIYYIP